MKKRTIIRERHRTLTGFLRWVTIVFSVLGLGFAAYQIFSLRIFGILIMENSYFYILMALYLSMVFLFFPLTFRGPKKIILAIDVFLFFITICIASYLAWVGYDIIYKGWGYHAPLHATIMATILWILVLEAARRAGGTSLFVVILIISLYPLFSPLMPGVLEGYGRSFSTTAAFHAMSTESLLGIPMRVFGLMLVGFIIFGIALQASGGGAFFLNLSYCILGRTRGGTAKVSVLSSALFGSLSGSVISNVVTTGSITIPAIKKSGYPPHYAGAIEAAASTGGVLMPPIMGATAFVMAAFLEMSYYKIALAAAIPSIFAYLGLLIQVDGYAARIGLSALDKSEIPSLKKTLKEGWFYLGAVLVLLYFLFALRLESEAPFYTILFLLGAAMIRKETRFTLNSFLDFLQNTGKILAELMAILAGVGMILGALALTGVAAAFAREIVALAGGQMIYMLIFGAFASFILGMGMTITACYVFLALVLAPALVMVGLNEVAVHLYVMYWGSLSYITPPVALAAFPAAVIAGAKPVRVGFTAMKLGGVKYLVPLFFVLDPSLVLQGSFGNILQAFISGALGILVIGSVLESYMIGVGNLKLKTISGFISGVILFVAGFVLALPGSVLDITNWQMDFLGLGLIIVAILFIFSIRFVKEKALTR